MSQSMTKVRITSWKERTEIALYCISYNNDYQTAAECYQVSYRQVYQWLKKYESDVENALKDSRGRKNVEEELERRRY
jgi:transposase